MKENTVNKIREFNRKYMPAFELLGNSYLGSEYSATEARILFEVYENDGCTAAFIAKKLNIDKSYLSRVVKNHEKNGLIVKRASKSDLRSFELHLTSKGLEMTEKLIELSKEQIAGIICNLDADSCKKLTDAMDTVLNVLKNAGENHDENSSLR